MHSPILLPAAVLVLWSLIMLLWTVATRVPALSKAGVSLAKAVGGNGASLDKVLPEKVQWPAHNYVHLMEQPTIFYATVFILALSGVGVGVNAQLAWVYVSLRIAHSLVQATVNRVVIRFTLFALSTVCLLVLAIDAVRITV